MSELAETGSVGDGRRDALSPYLDFLSASLDAANGEEGRTEPNLPPRLDLDRWEVSALEQGLRAEDPAAETWETLLAEGVALQAKFLVETEQLGNDDALQPELLKQVQDQLIQTAAIGLALQVEIQRAVDAMILGGQMNQAKKLTQFRNKLGQMVGETEDQLGAEAFALAEALGEIMVTPLETSVTSRPRLEEQDEAPPTQAKFDKYANLRPARAIEMNDVSTNHAKPLLVLFAIVVAVWAIFIAPGMWTSEIPTLSQADLAFSPAIQQVTARPPSLYLVVDGPAWKEMASSDRQALVLQVGQTAEAAGYTGVNIRLGDGTTVGQWSIVQGVKLIARTREKS